MRIRQKTEQTSGEESCAESADLFGSSAVICLERRANINHGVLIKLLKY
jgi:hypothetical protein